MHATLSNTRKYTFTRIPELDTLAIQDAQVCVFNYLRKHTYLLDTLPEQIAMYYAQCGTEHLRERPEPELIAKICAGNHLKAKGERLPEHLALGLREMLEVVTEEYCGIAFTLYAFKPATILDAKLLSLLHCIWPKEWRHCT